jgi:trehalose 6-phosphate phosphatase
VLVSPTATLVQAVEPLRSDPPHAAVLLDVDGTLAPIVEHAEDAHVPEATRALLIEVTKRYGLVGCVSGRRAQAARQIVAIGSIAYIGNHGGELLAPGSTETQLLDPALASWGQRVSEFARDAYTGRLRALRVRCEEKGVIIAFHWRGARDEDEAEAALKELAEAAQAEGLAVHWGRKVLEIRPPVEFEKGRGIAALLREARGPADGHAVADDTAEANAAADAEGASAPKADRPADGKGTTTDPRLAVSGLSTAMYVGDDRTDLDAFRQLRSMVASGSLSSALCVAVASEEAPAELVEQADLVVDGPNEVRGLLAALL